MSIAMESWQPRHRINVDEFHRMAENGVLNADARVELIDGVIFDMAPVGIDHNWAVDRLNALFHRSLGDCAVVRTQGTLRLDEWNELLPDITLLKAPDSRYRRRHPSAEDVLLVVEVSDTTLRHDLKLKVPLYAAQGVMESWVVNVQTMEVHIHRLSGPGLPAQSAVMKRPGKLTLRGLPQSAATPHRQPK